MCELNILCTCVHPHTYIVCGRWNWWFGISENSEFSEVNIFTVCFIWKGTNRRKFLSTRCYHYWVTVFSILSPRIPCHLSAFSVLTGTMFYSHDFFHAKGVVKSNSWWQKKLLGLNMFVMYQMGWKARWKQSFITSCCPLNALFIQSKSSMAHKKYICCFIYYLPDMLLATRVRN